MSPVLEINPMSLIDVIIAEMDVQIKADTSAEATVRPL